MACACLALAWCGEVSAAERGGITVLGVGETRGKPTRVEINATLSGAAPMSADALVKYGDLKRRADEALQGLKLANLTTEGGGISVTLADGSGDEGQVGSLQVSKRVRLVLSEIGDLNEEQVLAAIVRVTDAVKDAGLTLGPPRDQTTLQAVMDPQSGEAGPVVFRLTNAEAHRERAVELAVADARRRAERLAKLTGVRLGAVVAVEDVGGGPESPAFIDDTVLLVGMAGRDAAATQPAAAAFEEVPMTAVVRVRFAIEQ